MSVLLASPCRAAPASEVGAGEWITVAPPGERFEVQMPISPTRTANATSSFLGTVEDVSYKGRRGEDLFVATRVDLPTIATVFMTDAYLFDHIRDSFLERGHGRQTSYVDVRHEGYEGKRLEFVKDGDDSKEDARAVFFLVGGELLTLTGIVPQGSPPDDVERFLRSLEIRDDAE